MVSPRQRAQAAGDHRPRDETTDVAGGSVQHDSAGHVITEARSFAVQVDANCQRVRVQRLRRGHAQTAREVGLLRIRCRSHGSSSSRRCAVPARQPACMPLTLTRTPGLASMFRTQSASRPRWAISQIGWPSAPGGDALPQHRDDLSRDLLAVLDPVERGEVRAEAHSRNRMSVDVGVDFTPPVAGLAPSRPVHTRFDGMPAQDVQQFGCADRLAGEVAQRPRVIVGPPSLSG
jgi:hypothetical protein